MLRQQHGLYRIFLQILYPDTLIVKGSPISAHLRQHRMAYAQTLLQLKVEKNFFSHFAHRKVGFIRVASYNVSWKVMLQHMNIAFNFIHAFTQTEGGEVKGCHGNRIWQCCHLFTFAVLSLWVHTYIVYITYVVVSVTCLTEMYLHTYVRYCMCIFSLFSPCHHNNSIKGRFLLENSNWRIIQLQNGYVEIL